MLTEEVWAALDNPWHFCLIVWQETWNGMWPKIVIPLTLAFFFWASPPPFFSMFYDYVQFSGLWQTLSPSLPIIRKIYIGNPVSISPRIQPLTLITSAIPIILDSPLKIGKNQLGQFSCVWRLSFANNRHWLPQIEIVVPAWGWMLL